MRDIYAGMVERSAESGKTWATRLEPTQALQAFAKLLDGGELPNGVKAVMLEDSHVLLYAVSSPWWNTDRWLSEQFFIRVGRGSTDKAMAALDSLARGLGCTQIVFATSLAARDVSLSRLLSRFGYSQESTQHIKDL
jgi:hypothetical protein